MKGDKRNVISFLPWENSKLILKAATSSTDFWDNKELGILGSYFCLYTQQSLTSMGFSPRFDWRRDFSAVKCGTARSAKIASRINEKYIFPSDTMARLPREAACQLLSVIPLGGLQNIPAAASLETSRSMAGRGSSVSTQDCWRASSPAETAEEVLATESFFLLTFLPWIVTPQGVR